MFEKGSFYEFRGLVNICESSLHDISIMPLPPMIECEQCMKVLSSNFSFPIHCRKFSPSKVSCYTVDKCTLVSIWLPLQVCIRVLLLHTYMWIDLVIVAVLNCARTCLLLYWHICLSKQYMHIVSQDGAGVSHTLAKLAIHSLLCPVHRLLVPGLSSHIITIVWSICLLTLAVICNIFEKLLEDIVRLGKLLPRFGISC